MDPKDWGGGMFLDGRFIPIMTDQPAAPPEILDLVCCSCKKDCSTKRCKKHGLTCTAICGECRATSCTNSQLLDLSDEYEPEGKKQRTNQELIGGARTKSHREGVEDPGWIGGEACVPP